MSESETVNRDAHEGIEAPSAGKTAADKLMETLREMSQPDEDAGEMALTLATLAMALEGQAAGAIAEQQESGGLDEWVLAMTRWFANHRSDSVRRLVVVELPRGRELPTGTRLHLLDEAIAAADAVEGIPF